MHFDVLFELSVYFQTKKHCSDQLKLMGSRVGDTGIDKLSFTSSPVIVYKCK